MNAALILLPALLHLAAPAGAPTETIGVVAVAPSPGPGPELVDFTDRLRAELSKRLEGVLPGPELRSRMEGGGRAAALAELERAHDAALDEVKRDPARGIPLLEKLLEDLERQPDGREAYELRKQVALRLARARTEYASTPEEAAAAPAVVRALLVRLLRADPDLVVDPLVHSRRVERMAQEVKAELQRQPTTTLTVASSAGDTRVFVDGRDAGMAPVTLTLPRGTYRITGQRGSLQVPGDGHVKLSEPSQLVRLDLSVVDALRPARGPGLALPADPEEDGAVARAAALLGLDRVVTARLHRERDAGFLVAKVLAARPQVAVLRQGWLRLEKEAVPLGGYADLAEFLVTGQSRGLVRAGPNPPGDDSLVAPAPPSPGASSTLGWVSVGLTGAAAVLGGVAAYEASSASGSYSKARNVLQPGGAVLAADAGRFKDLRSQGDSARGVAIATGVTAGLALAAGMVTGFVNSSRTGEFWPIRF